MNEKQKDIYNLYLCAIAKVRNRPYKKRSNFSGLSDTQKVCLNKLEYLFIKHPHLYNIDFFIAPYKIYSEKDIVYSLNFYSGSKGLAAYVSYFNVLIQSSPDEQLDYLKRSIEFVESFCNEKKIPLDKYSEYISISQNDCLLHLKNRYISFYVIFAIPSLFSVLYTLRSDEFCLYFGNNIDLSEMRIKYDSSRYAKIFIEDEVKRLTKSLDTF